jgi:hypothetical protein
MVTKIHRDALRSEIASLQALLEASGGRDPLGARSLQSRLQALEMELAKVQDAPAQFANVALVFDGEPVRGSSAIEAEFAGKALQDYQELIAKHVATDVGALAERGRLPDEVHQRARMNITALMHGSFGFVLEEDAGGQLGMFESAAQKAVQAVNDLLEAVSAVDGRQFDEKLNDLDVRIFQTLKRFVGTLHKSRATIRIAEEAREWRFDSPSVERAYDRMARADVEEYDAVVEGELLGLVPIQRRFEFRDGTTEEVLQGRVAENLSADYLERLEREGLPAGGRWRATIRTKIVNHPDGRHSSTSRLLIDLVAM